MFNKTNILAKLDPYIQQVRAYIVSLRDIRNVGLLVFTIAVLLISWSGIKTIQTNYGLQKQIARIAQQNELSGLENTNLSLQNQYYSTDQYLEVTARQNLGLAAPGETELLVPKSVALSHTVSEQGAAAKSEVPKQPFWQHNFESWMNFFFHRES